MSENILDYLVEGISENHARHIMLNEKIDDTFIDTLGKLNILTYRCSASNIVLDECSGFHLSDILSDLLKKANGDIEKAQQAVVIIEDFEQMSMNEVFMNHLVSRQTNLDSLSVIGEKYRRVILQMELTDLLSSGIIPVDFKENEVLFDTSKLSFVLTGDYKDLNLNCILGGYTSVLMDRLYPMIEQQKKEDVKGK